MAETNTEGGHWEADTVIGKGHDGGLLALVERLTQYWLIVKVGSKNALALAKPTINALRRSGQPVKTNTAPADRFDNGLEFACHELIGPHLGAATCFAHPYHRWQGASMRAPQRRTVNGLIQQYIPKDGPISIVWPTDASWIEDHLNDRPGRGAVPQSLGYLSPAEFVQNELHALQM